MNNETDSGHVMSFSSSLGIAAIGNISTSARRPYSRQQLGAKVEMVYSLLSMLGTNNRNDMSKTLLAMSSSPESCLAMRQSGCLPLLIQLIHSPELEVEVRSRAAEALQNIVHAQTDDKKRKRETRVLKLLEQIREYCDELKPFTTDQGENCTPGEPEKHPLSAVEEIMKFSFDAEHRQAICNLGGLHALAELIQLDHDVHGSVNNNPRCIVLRRYAGMALTNLIFGDGNNKALLCSFGKFMRALVSQLESPSEDLRQVTASVLRNLSWRADAESKQALREIGAVTALMVAAMEGKKESTLKSILSALWNLSAHCSMNKVDVCAVPGAVAFLVKMLRYKAASNTLAVVENAGGILRNISSHIAVREDYRQILRDNSCFEILLEQLKSPSLTIVSNACGTLWNLSARCCEDQRRLWEMGAISMLRSLIQSKHKMISMGSSAALKNLLSANLGGNTLNHLESTSKTLALQSVSGLYVRKQEERGLEQELDVNSSEACENIEPSGADTNSERKTARQEERKGTLSKRSDSPESVTSTQSDSAYEKVNQLLVKNDVLDNKNVTMHSSLSDNQSGRRADEQKLMKRYKSSMIATSGFKKMNQEKKIDGGRGENAVSETTGKLRDGRKTVEMRDKRGIPILKSKVKNKNEMQGRDGSCGEYYSGKDFNSQYEDEFPVNYSLKYSEPEVYGGKMRNGYVEHPKKSMKEEESYEKYRNYAETDLDQPTDFSLKYGEESSSDEELKDEEFEYFEGEKTKESGYYNGQPESEDTTRTYYTEGTPYEGTPFNYSSSNSMSDLRIGQSEIKENAGTSCSQPNKGENRKATFRIAQEFKSADESPIMFSRNSSLNSLSSFEEVHQSIMDDRSSVLSDFSPMTSGLISPSELPDSPTQTIPPSPKECKGSIRLPSKIVLQKRNGFESDPLTYKEGVERKELTDEPDIGSYGMDNSLKRHCPLKTDSAASSVVSVDDNKVKEELHHNSPVKSLYVLREQIVAEENEIELKIPDLPQTNQNLPKNCISSDMPENSYRPKLTQTKYFGEKNVEICLPVGDLQKSGELKKGSGLSGKKYRCESSKIFSACGESDDMVHTYCTEGTPANVSHAGSHSDLSSLSMITGGLILSGGMVESANGGYPYSQDTEKILANCILSGMPKSDGDYWCRKEITHQLSKDESSTFATENSPCNFSSTSSLNDLNANLLDSPICFSRSGVNGNETSNVTPSPNDVSLSSPNSSEVIESEDVDQTLDEKTVIYNVPEEICSDYKYFEVAENEKESDAPQLLSEDNKFPSNSDVRSRRQESQSSLNAENFYSSELTPLEQALLEQCIISGMPHKSYSKKSDSINCQTLQTYDGSKLAEIEECEENEPDRESGRKTNSPDDLNILPANAAENRRFEARSDYLHRNIINVSKEEDPIYDGGNKMNNFSVLPSLNNINVNSADSSICSSSIRTRSNDVKCYGKKDLGACATNQNPERREDSKEMNGMSEKKQFRSGKYQNEESKIFPSGAESEDVVHTYCTEGTPANISHAGSHSDLSNLSMMSGGLLTPTTVDDAAEDNYRYSQDSDKILAECILSGMPKAKHNKKGNNNNLMDVPVTKKKNFNPNKITRAGGALINPDVFPKVQSCNDFLPRKDSHLSAKDEISTFATENSPCNFSLRSSLSDLTVNSLDSSGCISRAEVSKHEKTKLSPCPLVASEPSSNSSCFLGLDEASHGVEENRAGFRVPQKCEAKYWDKRSSSQSKMDRRASYSATDDGEYFESSVSNFPRDEPCNSLNGEGFDSSETSPLEQALLEQCIISGMPRKGGCKNSNVNSYKIYKENRLIGIRSSDSSGEYSSRGKKVNSLCHQNNNPSSPVAEEDTDLYLIVKLVNR